MRGRAFAGRDGGWEMVEVAGRQPQEHIQHLHIPCAQSPVDDVPQLDQTLPKTFISLVSPPFTVPCRNNERRVRRDLMVSTVVIPVALGYN